MPEAQRYCTVRVLPGVEGILVSIPSWTMIMKPPRIFVRRSLIFLIVAGITPFILFSNSAFSHGVKINKAQTELVDDVLYLDASATFELSQSMIDALHEGVPLDFRLRIEIIRQRNFWVDDTLATLGQRYRLEYQALTQQYLIINPNSGSRHSFLSLEAALSVLGAIVRLPILDGSLLTRGAHYTGRILFKLDDDALPVPLRLRSYVTSEWRMKSEWFTWLIQD